MNEFVCPVWTGYLLVNPIRRIWQNPLKILGPYIRPGMIVADIGCAMGFFSLDMARMIGPCGRVICVDLQPRMIEVLEKRARRAGLLDLIDGRVCSHDDLNLDDLSATLDFALAFAVVHEVPDPGKFMADLFPAIRPGGKVLFSEPRGHVSEDYFQDSVETALNCGFAADSSPRIKMSRSVLLQRVP